MQTRSRPFSVQDDFGRVRRFLTETVADRDSPNWGPDRWDLLRFSRHADEEASGIQGWERHVRLWETTEAELVGAVTPEGRSTFFLQIHPIHRHLELEMIRWIVEHDRSARRTESEAPLQVCAMDTDRTRATHLTAHGFAPHGPVNRISRRAVRLRVPPISLPPGYTLRAVRLEDPEELSRLANTLNATFCRSKWTADNVRVLTKAPMYRSEMDLLIVGPEGDIAAFTTVWVDSHHRTAIFEPVGTHPAHRRRGLARALLATALQRLQDLGIDTAETSSVPTNTPALGLYRQIGFEHAGDEVAWRHAG